jgi:dTMP kinase
VSQPNPTRPAASWITFEGIEGSGKSTQVQRVARLLQVSDTPVVVTREPGGTELGRRLRTILLDPAMAGMDATPELLLYTADRAQHLQQVILPALAQQRVVLCDRFLDATLAYQGYGRGLGVERILELHRHPPLDRRPDRTLLLDLDPERSLERARRRNRNTGVDETDGRFEQERLEFHRKVRQGYLELAAAEPRRIRVIDAGGEVDEVATLIRQELLDLLPGLGGS